MTTQPAAAVLPLVERFPAHLEQRGGAPALTSAEYLSVIKDTIAHHPRSLQKRIGPSEIGHPCLRRIGYKLLDVDDLNPADDTPWLPTIGTAVHAWLEDAFTQVNAGHDHARWLTELRVDVGSIGGVPITGCCDLYDRVTATVIDHKVVGPTQLKKYRAKGPGEQYRSQIHLYGRGLTRRGLPVDTVSIAFLPRSGELTDAYVWTEAYDEQVALVALERANGISLATTALGVGVLAHLATADAFCHRCPFFVPGSDDLATGCPGDAGGRRTPPPPLTLTRPTTTTEGARA